MMDDIQVSTNESMMHSTSGHGSMDQEAGKITTAGGDGVQNLPSSSNNNNQSNVQRFVSSLLQIELNTPPPQQQTQQTCSNGTSMQSMSRFQGLGYETGMDQQQQQQQTIHSQISHNYMQPHQPLPNQLSQHHLMDSQRQLSNSPQMNLAQQQLPPAPQYNANQQSLHPHTHNQYNLPFGISNSNYGATGMAYGSNMSLPQMMPFQHHHHIPNQQQSISLNPMQQQQFYSTPAPPAYAHTSFQQQSLGGPCAVGWMGRGLPTLPVPNNPTAPCNTGYGNNNNNNNNGSKCVTSPPSRPRATRARVRSPTNPDPNEPPGGLEVLWRELHPDCQKLMTPHDIPYTAKARGYFTVFELLGLKRALEKRHRAAAPAKPSNPNVHIITPVDIDDILGTPMGQIIKEVGKRGPKRKNSNAGQAAKAVEKPPKKTRASGNKAKTQQQQQEAVDKEGSSTSSAESLPQDQENGSSSVIMGELAKYLDNAKDSDVVPDPVPQQDNDSGVGGAVKAAMDTLDSNSEQQEANATKDPETSDAIKVKDLQKETVVRNGVAMVVIHGEQSGGAEPSTSMSEYDKITDYMKDHTGYTEKRGSPRPSSSGFQSNKLLHDQGNGNSNGSTNAEEIQTNKDEVHNPSLYTPPQPPPYYHPSQSEMGYSGAGSPSMPNRRTVTIVMKLLQIGPIQIRSFSQNNPNKLKVYFTNQRMTYECQLPVFQPSTDISGPRLMRQTLHVNIGLEQISQLEFKSDSLLMRVEGAPLLQLLHTPVFEESPEPNLTQDDLLLLDQIQKGSLKMNPVHQLFFLNERLVRQLEAQCQDYPAFQRFFQNKLAQ